MMVWRGLIWHTACGMPFSLAVHQSCAYGWSVENCLRGCPQCNTAHPTQGRPLSAVQSPQEAHRPLALLSGLYYPHYTQYCQRYHVWTFPLLTHCWYSSTLSSLTICLGSILTESCNLAVSRSVVTLIALFLTDRFIFLSHPSGYYVSYVCTGCLWFPQLRIWSIIPKFCPPERILHDYPR